MPKQTNYVKTQIRIPPTLNERIEIYAQRQEMSKNEAMLVLMSQALRDYDNELPPDLRTDAKK